MAIKRLGAQRFSGLEADVASLPIDADLIGAIFSSTDTLKFWIFNGTTWNESAGGGGITGINTNSTIIDHSTTLADYTSPGSASATSEDGANVAANAVDGSTATFWKSNAGINESITIDMGSVVNDFALAFYIDKTQTGITETQFQIKTLEITGFDMADLKAYYKFDVGSGDIINQSVSGESLGTDADMIITAATYSQPGIIDDALSFNGTTAFGELGTSLSQWSFLKEVDAVWSISGWFNLGATANSDLLIGNVDATEFNGITFTVTNDTGIQFQLWKTSGLLINTSWSGIPSFGTGVWRHFVLTVDLSEVTNSTELWIDGVSQGFKARSANDGNTDDSEYSLKLCTNGNEGATVFLNADIDELSIWNRVLTDVEVVSLYNSGNGLALTTTSQPAETLRTIKVIDLVDQEYNFIRFNGINAQKLQIEGSSGSSLVMAANDLQVLVEADPPLVTSHGQFEINETNDTLALNGGDPVSSVIEDPQVNSITLNNVGTQADPISGASVMWQQNIDANNDTTRIKMKINGSIEEVRFF